MVDRSLKTRIARSALRAALSAPPHFLRGLAGPAPVNDRGHALDLSTHALLRLVLDARKPSDHRGIGLMRHEMDDGGPIADFPPAPLLRIEERAIRGPEHHFAVRIYEPRSPSPSPRPVCLYFHGGGFVLGSLRSHDGVCGRIAERAKCLVVSVDYRLAPEHRFPAAAHDAIAAYRWCVTHARSLGVDPRRIAVAGDSAGGNLAAVVAWHERASDSPPSFQLLVYPSTDLEHPTESYRLFATGYLLETNTSRWFRSQYLRHEDDLRSPLASVMRAPCLRGTPPAHIVTAGFDPLRDEGEAYARKLAQAGVRVALRCEQHLTHGFFSLGGILDSARRAIDRSIDVLASELHDDS